MTQNGLKHILNMFVKSATKTDRDPPSQNAKNVHIFFKASLNWHTFSKQPISVFTLYKQHTMFFHLCYLIEWS